MGSTFEQVVMLHLDSVYRMACRLSGDAVEAEDLVQETFLRAYRAFDGFELRQHGARPWLLKILHNVFYTRVGQRRRQPTLMEDADFDHVEAEFDAGGGELPSPALDWEQFDGELKSAVEELAPEYREVLLLWALEELSYKEIAGVCECAIGTVMSRLYRARQQVARRLGDYCRRERIPQGRVVS